MNYCGVVCEYNPFHTGHLFQLKKIREMSCVDGVICVMSGNFVQRAEPAIVNKHIRARLALENGADAVVQIPTAYTVCGGEKFSSSALGILSGISGMKYLAFGCETENFDLLKTIAEIRANESQDFRNCLYSFLDSGIPYPKALSLATLECLKKLGKDNDECAKILASPNNILAIEYLKAIYKNNYDISPIFIHRKDNYNSTDTSGRFASATAIRTAILQGNTQSIASFLPYDVGILEGNFVDYKLFDQLLLFSLRRLGRKGICSLADCGEGIENKLFENAINCTTIDEALDNTKSKRYTYARLKRIAIQAFLGVTALCVTQNAPSYGKLLAIKKELKQRLSDFTEHIVIRHKDIDSIAHSHIQKNMEIDQQSDDFYALLSGEKGNSFFGSKLIEL